MSILLEYGMMMIRPQFGGEQEEVPLVLVEMEEGGCMDMGNNKWWTKWLGVESSPKEMESTKPNNKEESDSSMSSNGTTNTAGLEAWSQKRGPKHACGLCCRPLRAKEGAMRCSHGHWMRDSPSPRQRRFSAATCVPMQVQKGKASQMVAGGKREAPAEEERATPQAPQAPQATSTS